jgi:hypothetical protein
MPLLNFFHFALRAEFRLIESRFDCSLQVQKLLWRLGRLLTCPRKQSIEKDSVTLAWLTTTMRGHRYDYNVISMCASQRCRQVIKHFSRMRADKR